MAIGENMTGKLRVTRKADMAHSPKAALKAALAALIIGAGLAGCAGKVVQHGHMLTSEEIAQVTPGMSRDQVQLALGSPDTTSTMGGDVFYYISTKRKGLAFLKPKVIDRRIVAVYFNKSGNVSRVAHYGLKDGKVFDFISRKTPSHGGDMNILQQLLGNFGKKTSIF
jgi:outer membrane protein assembly factor BamE (lipoprotein component of BamABCDE complex)